VPTFSAKGYVHFRTPPSPHTDRLPLPVPLFRSSNYQSVPFLSATHPHAVTNPLARAVIGETWRSRRSDQKKRDAITDSLAQHDAQLDALRIQLEKEMEVREEGVKRERELEKIVEEVRSLPILSLGLKRSADAVDESRLSSSVYMAALATCLQIGNDTSA
jgi:hypothetical protein